jgi:hypothetical protein
MNKEKKDPFGLFDLGDFKKWMKTQNDSKIETDLIGFHVESKVTLKKLISKMEVEYGVTEEVARDFKKNGGTITEADGNKVLVEVENGTFIIHKMYVSKNQD